MGIVNIYVLFGVVKFNIGYFIMIVEKFLWLKVFLLGEVFVMFVFGVYLEEMCVIEWVMLNGVCKK